MNTKKLTILFLLNSLFIEGPLASINYRETSDDSYSEEKLDMHDPKDFSETLKYSLEKGLDELQSFESEIDESFVKKTWRHPIKGIQISSANIVQKLKLANPDLIVADYDYRGIFIFDELVKCHNPEVFTIEHSLLKLLSHLESKIFRYKKIETLEIARSILSDAAQGYLAIHNWPFWDKEIEYFELIKKLNNPRLTEEARNIFETLCLPGDRFDKSVTFNKHLQLLKLYNFVSNKPPRIDFETSMDSDDFFKIFAQTQRSEIIDLLNRANQTGFQCRIFYGIPGVGKDSTINQLAALGLASVYRTGSNLVQLLQEQSLNSDRDISKLQIITIEGEITPEENPIAKEFLRACNWIYDESGQLFFKSEMFGNPIPLINTLIVFTTNYLDVPQKFLSEHSDHLLKGFMNVIEFGRFYQKNVEEIAIPNNVRESIEIRMKRMRQQDRVLFETRLGIDPTLWWNSIKEKALSEEEEAKLIRDIDLLKEDLFVPLPNPGEITLSMRKLGGEIRKLINLYIRDLQEKGE